MVEGSVVNCTAYSGTRNGNRHRSPDVGKLGRSEIWEFFPSALFFAHPGLARRKKLSAQLFRKGLGPCPEAP